VEKENAMTNEPSAPPADRPATGAGAAKVTGFADRVRLGAQVQKAKALRAEIAVRHQAFLAFAAELQQRTADFAAQLETCMADADALIEGLEREMGTPRPGNS